MASSSPSMDQFFAGIGIDDGEGERVVASNVTDRIRHLQAILQRTGEEEAALLALAASGSRDNDSNDEGDASDDMNNTEHQTHDLQQQYHHGIGITDYKLPGRPTTSMGSSASSTAITPTNSSQAPSTAGSIRGSRRAAQQSSVLTLTGPIGSGRPSTGTSPANGNTMTSSSSSSSLKPSTPPHARVISTGSGAVRTPLSTNTLNTGNTPTTPSGTSTPSVPLYGRRGRPTVVTPPPGTSGTPSTPQNGQIHPSSSPTSAATAPSPTSPLSTPPHDDGKRSAEDEELVALMNDDSKEIAQREMKYAAGTTPPLVSGWLMMQKSTGKWKKLLCSYSEGCLHYKGMDDGQKRRMVGSIKAAFCEAELNTKAAAGAGGIAGAAPSPAAAAATSAAVGATSPTGAAPHIHTGTNGSYGGVATTPGGAAATAASGPNALTLATSGPLMMAPIPTPAGSPTATAAMASNTKYDELYWSYLESQEASHAFKLFSPNRLYIFRAETDELRTQFVDVIRKDLQSSMSEQLWQDKCDAMKEFNPLLREQFILQVNRYNALVKSLAKSGFMEDDLPITSTRKEKSGVLCMETPHDFTKWRDYYFVLFEGSLFYYKDSKSTTPTGFVTLRFASVHLDTKRLSRGEYVFHVKTPLRTVACKTKHAVALSEWIACLENALNGQPKGKSTKKSSLKVLQDINKLLADVSTVESLIEHPVALQYFKKYLIDETKSSNELDFYVKAEELSNNDELAATELRDRVTMLYDTYIKDDAKERLLDLTKAARLDVEAKLNNPSTSMYKECCKLVYIKLSAYFNAFKRTDAFRSLNALLNKTTVSDKREVSPFDGTHLQSFVLKVKGSKRSKDIKFNKKSNVFTIGRDKSNNLVIEDSRVSRSHARVEYTDTQCEYIDLGSSCGSKLNGKPVLRAKLQPGDVIELGQSTLIFQVKPKRRFSLFG